MASIKRSIFLMILFMVFGAVFAAVAIPVSAGEVIDFESDVESSDNGIDAAVEKNESELQSSGAGDSRLSIMLSTPVISGFESLDSGVRISWSKVLGASKYRVYYYGRNGWTSMGDTTSTSFIDTDVASCVTYTYSVQCVSADGTEYTSKMNTTGWKYTYNMDTPRITNLTSTDKGVRITWGKVKNASRYRVYYKNRNNNWVKMAEVTGTDYLDTDVEWGNNYTYTVRCVNANGRFTSDCDTTGWKHQHYLKLPEITSMTDSSNGVRINWSPVPYAERYRVYYKNRNGNWVKMAEVTDTNYLDDDVSYGYTYTYTVRCVNSKGEFTSDCSTSGWKHTYYLTDPQITGFSSVGKGVRITWNKLDGAERYRVYYYGSNGWTRMGELSGTSFIDEDVRVGTTYRYTVRCVDSSGRFTSDCNTDGWKYTYAPNLSAPRITECETVSDGVKIYWSAVSNAYKYRVYYRNRNNEWVKMGDTTDTSFVDDVVKGGTTYTYAVRCLAAKEGDFASGYSVSRSHTYVDNPTITMLQSVSNGVKITWSAPAGATRYRIYYLNRNHNWTKMAETGSNSYLDTDVTSGGHYTYTVRCVASNGDFTSWFNTSGWDCTYNYTNWSSLYKDFIYNQKYLNMIGSGNMSYTNGSSYKPDFRLHDFDKDGIPELIGFTGISQWSRNFVMHVYTIKNNKVVYLNMIIASNLRMGKSTDSRYPGLFCYGGSYDIYRAHYIGSNNGQVQVINIAVAAPKERADWDSGINLSVADSELYQAYKNCCTNTDTSSYFLGFKEKYPVVGYTYGEITSMGWNSFIAKYGYV